MQVMEIGRFLADPLQQYLGHCQLYSILSYIIGSKVMAVLAD